MDDPRKYPGKEDLGWFREYHPWGLLLGWAGLPPQLLLPHCSPVCGTPWGLLLL